MNCSRDHTILFVAFDLEETQPKSGCSGNCSCSGGKCGSSFFVKNLTQHLKNTGAGFQGAFILETILNYNNTKHSQIFPDQLKLVLSQAYTEISQNMFRGDFLALIGRAVDDRKLLSATSKTFKKNGKYFCAKLLSWNNYFLMVSALSSIAALTTRSPANGKRFKMLCPRSYLVQNTFIKNQPFLFSTETFKAIELAIPFPYSGRPSSWPENIQTSLGNFFRSDHYYFWDADPSLPAVFLTDSANFRGYMVQCYHKSCDDMSHVTPEMVMFLGRTSANMAELATSMTNETCQMKKTGRVNIMFRPKIKSEGNIAA